MVTCAQPLVAINTGLIFPQWYMTIFNEYTVGTVSIQIPDISHSVTPSLVHTKLPVFTGKQKYHIIKVFRQVEFLYNSVAVKPFWSYLWWFFTITGVKGSKSNKTETLSTQLKWQRSGFWTTSWLLLNGPSQILDSNPITHPQRLQKMAVHWHLPSNLTELEMVWRRSVREAHYIQVWKN